MTRRSKIAAVRLKRRREVELALAWSASRLDGQVHGQRRRALGVIVGRVDDGAFDGGASSQEGLQLAEDVAPDLPIVDRAHLFLTTAWTAIASGHTRGAEVWVLCELRRALQLRPTLARRLYRLAAQHPAVPGRRPHATLARLLAEGCRIADIDGAPQGPTPPLGSRSMTERPSLTPC